MPIIKATPKKLANHEIVVVAAFLAGAESVSVDTEDIAIKANELAPGRFSWRKYKEQINIDTVRKRLWDATKAEKGGYLIGSERTGWRLTKAGFDFANQCTSTGLFLQDKKNRTSQVERASQTREIRRMLEEEAFLKINSDNVASVTKADAERFFRLDDYVTGRAREAKIERFRIIAADNADLVKAINILRRLVKES